MPPAPVAPKDRIIVALDVASVAEARGLIGRLGAHVGVYKIGMQLGFAGGLELARGLAGDGHKVFLDLKLLDISNTVAKGIESIMALGAAFTTVHAYPQTMRAAAAARGAGALKVLGVTVLTSMDGEDLKQAGYAPDYVRAPAALVERRARQALQCGIDGVIASPREAAAIRAATGPDFLIITPGIRPAGSDVNDQKRITTPGDAIRAGADYLVIGRPITAVPDPRAAAAAIADEIAAAAAS